MTAGLQPRSTITTVVAMRSTPSLRINNGPMPSSARPPFTAGPKTRPARPPRPKARRSRLIYDLTDLRSIDWPPQRETLDDDRFDYPQLSVQTSYAGSGCRFAGNARSVWRCAGRKHGRNQDP